MSQRQRCKHGRWETECRWCITSGAWAIVKDSREMERTGHVRVVLWAREYLELENRATVVGTRNVYDPDGDVNP